MGCHCSKSPKMSHLTQGEMVKEKANHNHRLLPTPPPVPSIPALLSFPSTPNPLTPSHPHEHIPISGAVHWELPCLECSSPKYLHLQVCSSHSSEGLHTDPVVKTPHSHCRGAGPIPGQKTRIAHAARYDQKIRKKSHSSERPSLKTPV